MALPALGLLAAAPSFLSSLSGAAGAAGGATTSVPQSSAASISGPIDQGDHQTQAAAFVVGGRGSTAGGGALPATMTLPVQAPGAGLWLGLGAALLAAFALLRTWRA